MRQALHIFKKDVGHLHYDAGFALLAAVVFCFWRNPVILPAAWWFLISRVIHAEPLPGRRQFWRTRPYEWKSLLGAKLLFIFVFVHLPLLLADAVIVRNAGFSIGNELGGLIWTQILLTAAVILPAAAMAAFTSGIVEILTVSLLLILGFLGWVLVGPMIRPSASNWLELEWVKSYVAMAEIGLASALILVWQYGRRKTFAVRVLAAVTAVVVAVSGELIPWRAAFAVQEHFSTQAVNASLIRVELDAERKWLGRVYAEQDQMVAELPLQMSGLPAGLQLKPNGLSMTLTAADGERWVVDQPPQAGFDVEGEIPSLRAVMGKDFYLKVKDQLLQIRGRLYGTVYAGRETTALPLNNKLVSVDGIGMCSAGGRTLLCHAAFRPQADTVWARLRQGGKEVKEKPGYVASYSPFPAELNVDPLFALFAPRLSEMSEANVETSRPVAFIEREFEIENARLSDFSRVGGLSAH